MWDNHDENLKTHFFGKTDDLYAVSESISPVTNTGSLYKRVSLGRTVSQTGAPITNYSHKPVAEEAYIEKVINENGGTAKVFDNSRVIMTPDSIPFSDIEFYTETSEKQQIIINKRWEFSDTIHGFEWFDGNSFQYGSFNPDPDSNHMEITSVSGDSSLRTPYRDQLMSLEGKYNYLIRVRLKRTSGSGWQGMLRWSGYDPTSITVPASPFVELDESTARSLVVQEPNGIDSDFVIVQWDMRGVSKWNESIINQLRFDFAGAASTYVIDWIEVGGLSVARYDDGVLKFPLRTEESIRRTRGTWAKIKYTAKTTDKFNIFAILAKYRSLYIK